MGAGARGLRLRLRLKGGVGRLKGHGSWLVKKDVVAKPPATCAGQEYKKKGGTGKTGKNFAFQAKKCPPPAQTLPLECGRQNRQKGKFFALGVRPPPGGSTRKARKGKRQNILPWVSDLPLEGQLGRQGREKGKVVKEA